MSKKNNCGVETNESFQRGIVEEEKEEEKKKDSIKVHKDSAEWFFCYRR